LSTATAACATPESVGRSTTERRATRRDIGVPSGSTGLSPSTRTTAPVITHHQAMREVWPHLAKRLSAYLRKRGASSHDTDDIVQECALRVLSRQVPFADADELLSWCLTVARNAHVDLHRGQDRLTADTVPDRPASLDVHEEVVARLRLQTVVEVWPQLSVTERRVLAEAVEEVPAPPFRREAVRLYVQRNRARQRLHALTAALAAVLVALGRGCRRQVLPLTTLTTAAAVTFLALASIPSHGSPAGQVLPRRHASSPVVLLAPPRQAEPGRTSPIHRAQPNSVAGFAPKASRHVLASAKGPDGYGASLESHDRPTSGGALACVGDLPLVPETCVPDPTRSAVALAQ
jgi:DNA-directed RNA polymerase specialized sigma24 family protein